MIDLEVDVKEFTRGMSELQQKHLSFAMMKALNATGIDVQGAERAQLRNVFTLRREQWADHSVKITHFAKKTELWTTVAIAPPGGGKGDILGKFETDTEKRPRAGGHIAIPVNARRTKRDIVKDNQRPKSFHLRREGNRIIGSDGTFILQLPDGRQLLLQRKGAAKRSRRLGAKQPNRPNTLLYIFVPKVEIQPDLHFVPTAAQVVQRMWVDRFGEAFTLAMSSAR